MFHTSVIDWIVLVAMLSSAIMNREHNSFVVIGLSFCAGVSFHRIMVGALFNRVRSVWKSDKRTAVVYFEDVMMRGD